MDTWKSGDAFEVRVRDKDYAFEFGRTQSGIFVAVSDDLNITVEGDTLPECREAAAEAVELLLEDLEDYSEMP